VQNNSEDDGEEKTHSKLKIETQRPNINSIQLQKDQREDDGQSEAQ
jgi:hypothetical protein